MSFIKVLPDNLINKIAAGEVVERPASVVKELIENSLDSGASEVLVDIEQAGKRLIRVADNGAGMTAEDAVLAFERHATSKIATVSDLESIRTMGFRGEALASIASVAQVRMLTGRRDAPSGSLIEIEGGLMRPVADAAASPGTVIEVRHLFFNTPARLKFLKSASTELSHVIAAVSHQAMARPEVRFVLTHERKTVLDLPASSSLRERAFQLLGRDLAENLLECSGERQPLRVSGLAGRPNYSRSDRSHQEFYVNGRYIRNASLTHALYEAYRDLIMRDRHPAAFIFLDIDPSLVDVNVHPAKAEVRFRNQPQVHDLVRDVLREALRRDVHRASGPRTEEVREAAQEYLRTAEAGPRDVFPAEFVVRGTGGTSKPGMAADQQASRPVPAAMPHSALPVPLAQVHDSFIIAQDNDGMLLIDQHAAHERVLFEKLQDQYAGGAMPVQDLLLPVQVELGHAEAALLSEHLADLERFGFHVEAFGGGTFIIRAVPALMTGGDYARLLADVLDDVKAHGTSTQFERLRDELLSVMACHPAIKVHRQLSLREMEGLIADLYACRMPHSCPHGRPTAVRFSMDDIRRMFKRI